MTGTDKAAGREAFPSGGFLVRLLRVDIEIRHMPQTLIIQ